ncbi:unnamed protein product [Toxocara canis]|nr:unnamed protein product [Toxocara canis]
MGSLPMSEERRRLLDAHLPTWSARLRLECVLVELQSRAVLNDQIIDIINSEKTSSMRRYQFIRQLQMRGNDAFDIFYNALINTNQR